ncbi:MAG: serine/threonine protein phosphatase [Alphaproteobacteria bacterium]|nr:serine/threonine protein phosphatase [Alphaproteobacteria bacterium]
MLDPGTRIYAIGDIHGRLDLLVELEALISADLAEARPPRTVAVYLGDYVDRGPDSRGVLDHLLDRPLPVEEVVHLLGNHEDAMRRFLDDRWMGEAWMGFGGRETLRSYGVGAEVRLAKEGWMKESQAALARALPERHRLFLDGLRLWHGEGGYLFVHAGIRPRVDLARQDRDDLIWIRDEFLDSDADHGHVVVHGHSITRRPEIRPNRIGIDTGAFFSGRLTALVLEGSERRFLST